MNDFIEMPPEGYRSPHELAGLPDNVPVLLGLSGGADSTALLHILVGSGVKVTAAHINHCIRGAEADEDEAFCREMCEKLRVPLEVLRCDVPAEAMKTGEGLEEAARRIRYSFFNKIMKERHIPILVTAHNADDNLETLLFNISRGSSTRGGCGIPPVRKEGRSAVVVRPILGLTKKEIIEYCDSHGLRYVTDSTNSDENYSRNRLRHKVLPELRRLNPDAAGAAIRFCDSLREDDAYLTSAAEEKRQEITTKDGLLTDPLSGLPRALSARILFAAAKEAGAAPERHHLNAMLDIAAEGYGSQSLPGGVTAHVRRGILSFSRDDRTPARDKKCRDRQPEWEISAKNGENPLPYGSGTLFFGDNAENCIGIYNLSTFITLNTDRIKGKISIRNRRPGDVVLISGMHKSLRKLLCDAHLPLTAEERRSLPVICDENGIIWAPGLRPRDGAAAQKGDPDILQIAYILPKTN